MKKLTLILSMLFLFFGMASAQDKDKEKDKDAKTKFLTYGIRTGLNMANIKSTAKNDTTAANGSKPLYHLGGYVRLNLGNKLFIQPELDFSAEGMLNSLTDSATRLNYLDIPINIVFKPVKFINIQAGPELGVLMSAVRKATATGDKNKATDEFNRRNLGINVGVGITLLKMVNITGIYNYGVTDLSSFNQVNSANEAVKWLNRTFQLSVSYNILGKKGKL